MRPSLAEPEFIPQSVQLSLPGSDSELCRPRSEGESRVT